METTKRPVLVVVDGEIVVPEPTEEELLALAQERVSGKVTAAEFLAFPDVRVAMTTLYRQKKLAELVALLEAEEDAKFSMMVDARLKLLADIAGGEARKMEAVAAAPVVVEQTATLSQDTAAATPPFVVPREPEDQHPYTPKGTPDWLEKKAKMITERSVQASANGAARKFKKSPERVSEEAMLQSAVNAIDSIDKLTTDGFALLRLHSRDTWQFRATQAMLSQNVGGLMNAFEADLPERFPDRGSVKTLEEEKASWLQKRNSASNSFENYVFGALVGKLVRHKEALARQAAPRGVGVKKRPDKTDKLAKAAKSLGISTEGKTESQLRSAIADIERAKACRKGSKPGAGRR